MWEGKYASLYFRLFKVAVFLGVGALIGFLLGLAYASHLYGTPPVVAQIESWLAGDALYQGPLPVDLRGDSGTHLLLTPISLIPKMGACFGFGLAASVLFGHIALRTFVDAMNSSSKSKGRRRNPASHTNPSALESDPFALDSDRSASISDPASSHLGLSGTKSTNQSDTASDTDAETK